MPYKKFYAKKNHGENRSEIKKIRLTPSQVQNLSILSDYLQLDFPDTLRMIIDNFILSNHSIIDNYNNQN